MILKLKYWILPVVCFVGVHTYLLLDKGIQEFYDSALYIKAGDDFIRTCTLPDSYLAFYFIPIVLIGFFRSISGGDLLPFVLFQIAFHGAALICMFRASQKLFNASTAGVVTVLVMIFWIDNVRWNTAVMTESIFCSLICITWYQITRFRGRTTDILVLILLVVMLALCRPTASVMILGVMTFVLMYFPSLRTRYRMVTVAAFAILVGAAYFMFSVWDFTGQYQKGNIVTYADTVEGTALAFETMRHNVEGIWLPDPDLHPLHRIVAFIWHNPLTFMKAFGMKVFYLLSATRPYYSSVHNILSVLWMAVLYSTACFGFNAASDRHISIAVCAVVVANCILVGMSTVDWDNRFYIPMAPGIALLAGGGAVRIARKSEQLIYRFFQAS